MNALLHNLYLSMYTFANRGIHFCYVRFIEPRSNDEDMRRHEFILNIILTASVSLTGLMLISLLITWFATLPDYTGTPPLIFASIVAWFTLLLALSRSGRFRITAYLLIGAYYIAITFAAYSWGIELPLAILGYVMTIVMAGILVSTRFGFFTTGTIGATVILLGLCELNQITQPALFWKQDMIRINDPFQLAILFLVIMTVSWLSNREIEHSLHRARQSERALELERDSLELRVEERTKQIKDLQAEKLSRLYHAAEFGKLSSGIFHDLMNPLNAVIANVSQLEANPDQLPSVQMYLEKAVAASRRMGDLLTTVRKQINLQPIEQEFFPSKEIRDAIDILQFRAREANVTLSLKKDRQLVIYGNPLKFHQVALNLIANAIDSFDECESPIERTVHVTFRKYNEFVQLKVTDHGCGIAPDVLPKIFDPFFTTKNHIKGMGLGLSTTKNIVEKDFGGTIEVHSQPDRGSTFSVLIPLRKTIAV